MLIKANSARHSRECKEQLRAAVSTGERDLCWDSLVFRESCFTSLCLCSAQVQILTEAAGSSSLLSCHPHPPLPTQGSHINIWPEDTGQGTHRNLQGQPTPSLVPEQGPASAATPSQQQQTAGELCTGHRDHPCTALYRITTF